MAKVIERIKFADKIAIKSKDPSTKVGAVFRHKKDTHPISFGYNGMPRGLDDKHIERNERPEKYQWYEHAERNGIYNVARPILENRIAFLSHFPNMESARAIVSCGIKKVLTHNRIVEDKNYERVTQLFDETGVELVLLDLDHHPDTFEKFAQDERNYFKDIKELKSLYSTLDKNIYYLNLTIEYGIFESISEDNKSATFIMDEKNYNPISAGVYGPPTNIEVTQDILDNKDIWYQEDVKNAIFNVVRDKLEDSIVEVTLCPCNKCALSIVSVSSKEVRTRDLDFTQEVDLRWEKEFKQSLQLFERANILVTYVKVPK